LSGDAWRGRATVIKRSELGEMLALNYRVEQLDPRQRLMLDVAWKLSVTREMSALQNNSNVRLGCC
jgi:hypothetical protein